jgi:hypothetical protein
MPVRPSQKAPAERLVADTYEKFIGPWPVSTKGNEWCVGFDRTITYKAAENTFVVIGPGRDRSDMIVPEIDYGPHPKAWLYRELERERELDAIERDHS